MVRLEHLDRGLDMDRSYSCSTMQTARQDHIVKWYARNGERQISLWMDKDSAMALAEQVFDNGMTKIVVEESHVCGCRPVLMLRC